jgi:putative redox protein
MNTKVKWISGMKMMATSGSGHQVPMDGPENFGGENSGSRPMEMLLMGLGGCTTVDVISILEKMKEPVQGCECEISANRAEDHPKIFTDIHIHFVLSGPELSPQKVQKAITLSAEKYCSASMMLNKSANITHDFEIK